MLLTPKVKLFDGFNGVIWPDLHAPKFDKPSINACLQYLKHIRKKNKPDFFLSLGDWCDFDSLSRFQVIKSSDMPCLIDEIKSAKEMLKEVNSILPKHCKKFMTMGNHDQRPEIYRLNNWDAKDQKLFGSYFGFERIPNAEVLYGLKELGWEWCDRDNMIGIGKALFTHGFYTNKTHAEKTLMMWFKTIIYGHVHNFSVFSRSGMDSHPIAAYSIGTLSRFDLSYLKGTIPNWTHMFGVIDYFQNGNFTFNPIPIIDGKFIKDGKIYG